VGDCGNAELLYGHGVIVNRRTLRKIMRTRGRHGLPGACRAFKRKANTATAADLVERRFDRLVLQPHLRGRFPDLEVVGSGG
jgi:hypothetical protein